MIINRLRFYESIPENEWPFSLPPVLHIARHGLAFEKPITFIVGENGSGKSTIIEGIAEAYGLDVRGGHGGRMYATNGPSKSNLGERLKLDLSAVGYRTKARHAQGFFLRSETAIGVFEYMSSAGVAGYGTKNIANISHGEGYMQVLLGRFKNQGLYLLDEPEAALSFTSSLALMQQLKRVILNGSQVICATHSPIITALPDADILEVSQDGFVRKNWEELQLVNHWKRYMESPETYTDDIE